MYAFFFSISETRNIWYEKFYVSYFYLSCFEHFQLRLITRWLSFEKLRIAGVTTVAYFNSAHISGLKAVLNKHDLPTRTLDSNCQNKSSGLRGLLHCFRHSRTPCPELRFVERLTSQWDDNESAPRANGLGKQRHRSVTKRSSDRPAHCVITADIDTVIIIIIIINPNLRQLPVPASFVGLSILSSFVPCFFCFIFNIGCWECGFYSFLEYSLQNLFCFLSFLTRKIYNSVLIS
jgi:hypothetical protein